MALWALVGLLSLLRHAAPFEDGKVPAPAGQVLSTRCIFVNQLPLSSPAHSAIIPLMAARKGKMGPKIGRYLGPCRAQYVIGPYRVL